MMRLLFLFLLLLLPAATAVSEENEGSADGGVDDEDLPEEETINSVHSKPPADALADETSEHLTMIVVIVAVAALTLSMAAVVSIMLVRRHMHRPQQGVYSVPTEQDHKGA